MRVRVTVEEREILERKAKMTAKTVSSYLRDLGAGYPIKSKVDQIALDQFIKIRADLGRMGGLLKLWLSNTKDEWDPRLGNKSRFNVELLVREIEQNKQELLDIARKVMG